MAVLAVGTVLIGLVCTIGLYLVIEAETSDPRVVDRATAEREAMATGGRAGDDGPRAGEAQSNREDADSARAQPRLDDGDR